MLNNKKRTYVKVFGNELGKEVLSDLRAFCHATKTTEIKDKDQRIDPYQMAILEGRRQVFMQIVNIMMVDYEDYYDFEAE